MTDRVETLWRSAASSFESESPELDAQILLAHVLGKSTTWLLTWPEYELTPEQHESFLEYVNQRQQGKPVAYIVGEQEFWSLPFKVTSATLIPRPDTECLVEEVLNQYSQSTLSLLDAGTGTGAIAIALAKERPGWEVLATDFSIEALDVAKRNVEALCANVNLVHGDWLTPFKDKRFDVIVSNPPYIDSLDAHLDNLGFEPYSALVAGNQGLQDIESLCDQAQRVLKPGGKLFIEHGYDQREAVKQIFLQNGYRHIVCKKDYAGNDRFTYGEKHE